MRTLVIDCATEACSVALFAGQEMIAGDYRVLGRGHAEQLIPMIAALPLSGKAQRVVVALGPGSFTGVRVGLAAARALAFAWEAELTGYPTLALVAAMARQVPGQDGAAVTVAMTGGHGEWFVQPFAQDGTPAAPVASLAPEQAAAQTTTEVIAGSQAEALVAARGFGTAHAILPDARAFSALVADRITAAVEPLYGRSPDARLPAGRLAR